MPSFRPTAPYSVFKAKAFRWLLIAMLAPCLHGQAPENIRLSSLRGSVRDSHDQPMTGVNVYLQGAIALQKCRTDSHGTYSFTGLPKGSYTVRAESTGYQSVSVGPFILKENEEQRVNLVLAPQTISSAQSSSKEKSDQTAPQFFDEPKFTVAGVTDAHPGGHGSDTVLRNTQALARATASLSGETSASPEAASVSTESRLKMEESLRDAVRKDDTFAANRQLAAVLIADGKPREALPFLERSAELNPGDYANSYDVARCYAETGRSDQARASVKALMNSHDNAELHHLLADLEEKSGNPLEATREYRQAAKLDPSETNFFDWGTELLIHSAFEPASDVFTEANRLFPRSVRILIGLGVTLYARGLYDQAAREIFEASDLNPQDPNPYLFLGRMQSARTIPSNGFTEKLARFASLQPENAQANYYYAVSLWMAMAPSSAEHSRDLGQIESLLQKAVRIDPKLAPAYLQLGILYSAQNKFPEAISSYQKAIASDPQMEDAHYRLAQLYTRAGDKAKAQQELQLFNQSKNEKAEQAAREQHEIQQFVYTLRDPNTGTDSIAH
jgi:tetratricopeptide (TPR) repeat protein